MRYIVAFISVLSGIAAALLEFHIAAPPHLKDSQQESAFVFDLCITFYATTYLVGKLAYALLRRPGDRDALGQWSGWHMLVLHGLALTFVFAPLLPGARPGPPIRPATILAVILVIVSVIECLRSITSRRVKSN